ncbi:hypothetical protein EV378_5552 [Pseudonocardia endophytica]|uniref:Uncharacterized protein n=1 Tax=Pseudonocardia endophytica TaxID=401976 RepID=A0A4R1HH69_PSEEN|nr:hypothetical protein EV378_5552 [Pseudonocardia endophytica]
MPDNVLPAPAVDLAALIPTQRVAEAEIAEPEIAPAPQNVETSGPERLALLWTLLGAVAGSAIVAVAFLVILTLLP